MSDSNLGKKAIEEERLSYFLDAYSTVTGTTLTVSSNGESPDFICVLPSGDLVGVELARSPHDYHLATHERIWSNRMKEAHELLDAIGAIVATKELKRSSSHWRTPNNTILVIELLDYSFESLHWTEEASLSDNYASTGFIEIWLADYSTLEPFGEVRLIGLYPQCFWGVHPQPALEGKPYG